MSFASVLYGSIPEGKCGGIFYFCCICSKKKQKNKAPKKILKRRKRKLKKKKKKRKKKKKKELFSWIVLEFNKRLEENKKVVSGVA